MIYLARNLQRVSEGLDPTRKHNFREAIAALVKTAIFLEISGFF